MAKNLEMVSTSNTILKNIVIIVIVIGIAYLVYYLYNKNITKNEVIVNVPIIQPSQLQENPKVSVQYGINGAPNGLSNPIMNKRNTLSGNNIVGEDNIEHFSQNKESADQRNCSSFPKDQLTADELLPKDNSSLWAQVNPSGEGSLKDKNFLQSGYHIGINTVGQTLRNANLQLRSEPPCPQVKVSPWLQATIEPDVSRKPFEIGSC
jgi:hypothetical protein